SSRSAYLLCSSADCPAVLSAFPSQDPAELPYVHDKRQKHKAAAHCDQDICQRIRDPRYKEQYDHDRIEYSSIHLTVPHGAVIVLRLLQYLIPCCRHKDLLHKEECEHRAQQRIF